MKRTDYYKILDSYEALVSNAFYQAVFDIAKKANRADLSRLIEQGDIAGVLEALEITSANLTNMLENMRGAYIQSASLEGGAAGVVFDGYSKEATGWLAEQSSKLIVEISEQQREAVKRVLTANLEKGKNPKQSVTELIGIETPKGRQGGIIGLTNRQSQAVENARLELELLDAGYFDRARRNKAFDFAVKQAIKNEKPLSQNETNAIIAGYSDGLLQYRGEIIARTEVMRAVSTGRRDAWLQAVAGGEINQDHIVRVWDATGDARTRESHKFMHGQKRTLNEPFKTPSGEFLMHPGDNSLGASAGETIGCRCMERIRVDYKRVLNEF